MQKCTSSSEYSPEFGCQYAYDGTEETGPKHEWSIDKSDKDNPWLEITLHKRHTLSSLKFLQRCNRRQQVKEMTVYFDDNIEQQVFNASYTITNIL